MAKLWRQADVWIWGSWIHPADTYSSHRWPWTLSSGILSSCRYAKAMLWTQFHIKTVVLKQLAVALTATMIWDGVRLRRTLAFFGRPFVKTVRPMLSVRCLSVLSCLSVCDVCALWPNSWTDQDETWRAGRPLPWPHCVRWESSCPSPKGAQPPPNFRPISVAAKWLHGSRCHLVWS